MNNYNEIYRFLSFWKNIAKDNPQYKFGTGVFNNPIYKSLTLQGVDNSNSEYDLAYDEARNNGEKVVNPKLYSIRDKFENDAFLYPFFEKQYCYYLNFVSNDDEIDYTSQQLKIYIPLDSQHIELGSKMIFDFISKNRIRSNSKIGSEIRFDDIVVRVLYIDDLKAIIDFVSNNEYIQEGLIKPNPFAFNYNGLALACDGNLSYNSVVAGLVDMYIGYKQNENINTVNPINFYKYLERIYNEEFVLNTSHSIEQYFTKIRSNKEKAFDKKSYEEVISLIINSNKKEFNLDMFLEHYDKCCYSNLSYEDTIQLLKDLLNLFSNKISSKKNISIEEARVVSIRCLETYLNEDEDRYIPSDFDFRNRIINSNFKTNMKIILESSNMSIWDFIDLEEDKLVIAKN